MQNEKAIEILRTTRNLMMERGYNGISFRDVAAVVGIKSSSIHYHYPTKAVLAEAAAREYREWCAQALADLPPADAPGMLSAYGDLFVVILKDQGRVCLGGVLASDVPTLPPQVQKEVALFFKAHHEWLHAVLQKGQQNGEIKPEIDPETFAATFVSSVEGAMMVARSIGKPNHLSEAIEQLIQLVRT